jgi:hypothetical protein
MLNNHKSLFTVTELTTITNVYRNCGPERKLIISCLLNGASRWHYIVLNDTKIGNNKLESAYKEPVTARGTILAICLKKNHDNVH